MTSSRLSQSVFKCRPILSGQTLAKITFCFKPYYQDLPTWSRAHQERTSFDQLNEICYCVVIRVKDPAQYRVYLLFWLLEACYTHGCWFLNCLNSFCFVAVRKKKYFWQCHNMARAPLSPPFFSYSLSHTLACLWQKPEYLDYHISRGSRRCLWSGETDWMNEVKYDYLLLLCKNIYNYSRSPCFKCCNRNKFVSTLRGFPLRTFAKRRRR